MLDSAKLSAAACVYRPACLEKWGRFGSKRATRPVKDYFLGENSTFDFFSDFECKCVQKKKLKKHESELPVRKLKLNQVSHC